MLTSPDASGKIRADIEDKLIDYHACLETRAKYYPRFEDNDDDVPMLRMANGFL